MGNYFFRRLSNETYEVMNNPSGFNSEIVDSSVTYAIGNDGNLYKYSNSTNNFALFYTPPSPLPTNNKTSITVHSDRIFINSTSTTSVWLYAYLIESSGLTEVLNFTKDVFFIDPEVEASPQLTKVFVVGNGNTTNTSKGIGYAFHIDWSAKTVEDIIFP